MSTFPLTKILLLFSFISLSISMQIADDYQGRIGLRQSHPSDLDVLKKSQQEERGAQPERELQGAQVADEYKNSIDRRQLLSDLPFNILRCLVPLNQRVSCTDAFVTPGDCRRLGCCYNTSIFEGAICYKPRVPF